MVQGHAIFRKGEHWSGWFHMIILYFWTYKYNGEKGIIWFTRGFILVPFLGIPFQGIIESFFKKQTGIIFIWRGVIAKKIQRAGSFEFMVDAYQLQVEWWELAFPKFDLGEFPHII
jgi:hypothetical protein